jgi:hypothetical protein
MTKPGARRLELMPLAKIQRAKKNPKTHDDAAIGASVDRFGFVEPIVRDERTGRLVAGHGRLDLMAALFEKAPGRPPVGVQARRGRNGKITEWLVPVIRGWRSKNDAEAAAYLVASNRISEAGGWDDRALADLLKELKDSDDLAGTGFDERMLANLVFVTRPESEVESFDAASEWAGAGMPEHDVDSNGEKAAARVVMNFKTIEDRDQFLDVVLKLKPSKITNGVFSVWWPEKPRNDFAKAKRFVAT